MLIIFFKNSNEIIEHNNNLYKAKIISIET